MLFSALALSSLFWTAPPATIELTVQSRGVTLAATLQLPATGRAPFPAIVLAHGSGRTTRDQMRWMAEPLLSMGLAVLTYDKRGVGGSTGTYVNVGTARSIEVFGDLSDDALACVAALKARKDIDTRRVEIERRGVPGDHVWAGRDSGRRNGIQPARR